MQLVRAFGMPNWTPLRLAFSASGRNSRQTQKGEGSVAVSSFGLTTVFRSMNVDARLPCAGQFHFLGAEFARIAHDCHPRHSSGSRGQECHDLILTSADSVGDVPFVSGGDE